MQNRHRGSGLDSLAGVGDGVISDPADARSLFRMCPVAAGTPLLNMPELAARVAVGGLHLKDESGRMGLGSFKALGAVHAIARRAQERLGDLSDLDSAASALTDEVFVCASAGNHGISVAAGARIFGARSVVLISETVSDSFARRLEEYGAEVVRSGADYEESMRASVRAAEDNGWTLLSDSSWPGYLEPAVRVMEGYLISGAEVVEAIPEPPSHILLQAGVGGFAAAMTALFRAQWGEHPTIVVVEPHSARCLTASILAGAQVTAPGPVSSMGRLDCKEASHVALARLAKEADFFVTVDDRTAEGAVDLLAEHGIETTPSGAAGLSALTVWGAELGMDGSSRVLAFVTEGPEHRQPGRES